MTEFFIGVIVGAVIGHVLWMLLRGRYYQWRIDRAARKIGMER